MTHWGPHNVRLSRPHKLVHFILKTRLFQCANGIHQTVATVGLCLSRSGLYETRTEISHSVQFYPATFNEQHQQQQNAQGHLILGRSTHAHRFNYSRQFWRRKPSARGKVIRDRIINRVSRTEWHPLSVHGRSLSRHRRLFSSALVHLFIC